MGLKEKISIKIDKLNKIETKFMSTELKLN